MSIALVHRALLLPIDTTSKVVLISLADHANDEGLGVYPSLAYTELRTSLTRRAIQKSLQHLESHRIIEAVRNRRGGSHTTEWKINAPLVKVVADGIEAAWQSWRDGERGVHFVHPFAEGGERCSRGGCMWSAEGVHDVHSIRQRTVIESADSLSSIQNPRLKGEEWSDYLARLSLLRKEA